MFNVLLRVFAASALISLFGFFIVNQTEQVLILEFGQLKKIINKPGPYWRIPWVQQILTYEKRILNCDISEIELTLGDQKRIIVSVFARYFIKDPEMFYKTVQNEDGAKQRLDVIINGDLRNILGQYALQDILSEKRDEVEHRLSEQVRESMLSMGMDIMDIKLKAILFPSHNRRAVFERMKSERFKEAQEWRGKAIQSSSEIRSKADITAAERIAKERMRQKQIEGEAEARAIQITLEGYNQNPELSKLYITAQRLKDKETASLMVKTSLRFL
jgi:membrane protease subunit HflC